MQACSRVCVLGLLLALGVDCGRRDAGKPAVSGESKTAPAAAQADDAALEAALAQLTQALRRYGVEQRQVPASLDDLVARGYLKQMPEPPAGKTFAIDVKNVRVIVH